MTKKILPTFCGVKSLIATKNSLPTFCGAKSLFATKKSLPTFCGVQNLHPYCALPGVSRFSKTASPSTTRPRSLPAR